MDAGMPRASALAVRAGKLAYVGDDASAKRWIGPATTVLTLQNATVLPGLIDSHIHAAEGALTSTGCTLADKQLTLAQAASVIRDCVAADTTPRWLVVTNVNGAGFQADRRGLDAIVADRPLFLWGSDGHTGWANSKALALAGISRATRDPEDGRIERDAAGEPTGFLVDGAVELVLNVLDKPTPEKRLRALRDIQRRLHAAGITAYLEANTSPETVAAYAEFARRGELASHVTIALQSDGVDTAEEFERLARLRDSVAGEPLLRADFIKLFADGVMESPTQTAAMLEPYNVQDGTAGHAHGKLYLDPKTMSSFVQHADAAGFNVHVHAIGDAAVRETLDAFAAARAAGSRRLYSISHLQLIDPADLPRFAELDVIASLQLLWAQPDNYSVEAIAPYIGPDRHRRIYPARSLVAKGATIAGGSDWDVSSFNPFEAMATGMSRINTDEPARGALNADEALTLDELLHAYTIGAARLLGREDEIGSLTPGKSADFIVLDRQLDEKADAGQVRTIEVVRTVVGGRQVVP